MHEGYRCNGCNKIYDSMTDAVDCSNCYPDLVWVCDTCSKEYFDEDLARECEEGHN